MALAASVAGHSGRPRRCMTAYRRHRAVSRETPAGACGSPHCVSLPHDCALCRNHRPVLRRLRLVSRRSSLPPSLRRMTVRLRLTVTTSQKCERGACNSVSRPRPCCRQSWHCGRRSPRVSDSTRRSPRPSCPRWRQTRASALTSLHDSPPRPVTAPTVPRLALRASCRSASRLTAFALGLAAGGLPPPPPTHRPLKGAPENKVRNKQDDKVAHFVRDYSG
jgi:hypothetical protein